VILKIHSLFVVHEIVHYWFAFIAFTNVNYTLEELTCDADVTLVS